MTTFGTSRWRYSAYTGTGDPDFDAADVLAGISDDLLYHGDLAAALRRLLQDGVNSRSGQRVEGIRHMMERLRERREQLAQDQNALAEHVQEALDNVLGLERAELESAADKARADGDEGSAQAANESLTELALLPDDLAGQVQALMGYDFSSDAARQAFEELLDELRSAFAQSQLDAAAGAMASATPEQREHLRAGLDALNRMLEQRASGQELDPSFEQFMAEFSDLFPGNPADLDELLADLAQRMAAASAMVAAMSPEQRAQLEALSESLLSEMDLSWQINRLGANLRDLLPELAWDQPLGDPGLDPLSVIGASDAISAMAELTRLEKLLREATDPASLAEIDPEQVSALLGPEAAEALRRLTELTRLLEEAGLVARKDGRLALSPEGLRRLGSNALSEVFSRLRADRFGNHAVAVTGLGHDRVVDTKPYEYGDPFRLDLPETLRNALLRRATSEDEASLGVPVRLAPDDFAIEQTEHITSASTVLAIDLSLSMPMRDNFLSAKKVAIALQALIAQRFPRDYLGLIGFSATAREIRPAELPEVSWDFAYGTNLEHALSLARRMLARHSGSKQVIVITDGEPTAHVLANGEVFFNYPPVRETIEATLAEVARCTKERIVINTFVLDATGGLRSFVEAMTRMNRGRAFYTTPESLGDYLLVDFVEHRSGERIRHVRPSA